jgi:S-adenosylmethionine hydrolase
MSKILAIQTDFGRADGAVAAMYGVALKVSRELRIFDLTHDIAPYDIFQASYKLFQTLSYWPEDSVIVSVIDPGVGSSRKSVAVELANGLIVVTPDNGTVSHVERSIGIKSAWQIDENKFMRADAGASHTFHGRDLYANVGARLAVGELELGDFVELDVAELVRLELPTASLAQGTEGKVISGSADVFDGHFGNLWTNVPAELFAQLGAEVGDRILFKMFKGDITLYNNTIKFGHSFADVLPGETLIFVNSVYHMGVAVNRGNFTKGFGLEGAKGITVEVSKA